MTWDATGRDEKKERKRLREKKDYMAQCTVS